MPLGIFSRVSKFGILLPDVDSIPRLNYKIRVRDLNSALFGRYQYLVELHQGAQFISSKFNV